MHNKWIDYTFSSVEYIVQRYSCLFPGIDMNKLNEQFLASQLLVEEKDIPKSGKTLQDLSLIVLFMSRPYGPTLKMSKSQGQERMKLTYFLRLLRL